MAWTKVDRARVGRIIDHCASKYRGGQAEMARELGLGGRAKVTNWRKRGQIPVEAHAAIIRAAKPEMAVIPAELHPDAKLLKELADRESHTETV